METPEIKTLDMTRRIRDGHYEQTHGMTRAERIAFYRAKARELQVKTEARLQEDTASSPPATTVDERPSC